MTASADAQVFAGRARRSAAIGELTQLLSEVTRELGFGHVTLLHHVNLADPPPRSIAYSDYPMDFLSVALARRYFSDDPILAGCQRTAAPFLWSDVHRLVTLNPRQQEILQRAALAGLSEGFTVPFNVPGEPGGSCSFGARSGTPPTAERRQAAYWVAAFAFEQARRLVGLAIPPRSRRRLTARQFDCVVLAGQGKSDGVIAQLLGLSPETVHQHLEAAKGRYRVATRPQLVAACLADGELTFADVLR